eukprot:66313_1
MQPVPVLILSVLFLKQKLNFQNVTSMIIAIIGILFFVLELSSPNLANHKLHTHDTYYGIILTVLWTLGLAIYDILLKQLSMYCFDKNMIIIGSILCTIIQGNTSITNANAIPICDTIST